MHSSIVLFSTLAASALGATNSTTYTFPQDFNIGLVKPDELNSWCQGQRNVCPDMCQGSTSSNSCDPSTLQFKCTCADGTTPDSSQYIETIPFYVCQATFGQCINAHPNDADGQKACKQAAQCATKNATAMASPSPSTSTSASRTMALTTSTSSSQTTSSSVAAQSTSANAAITIGEGYSTGIMAGAMFLAARMFL